MAITILSKRDLIDERYLRTCDTSEVRAIIAMTKEKRADMHFTRGYSSDKELRALGDIPTVIYNHPAFRHVFHNQDSEEGAKNRKQFLREYSDFRLVDNI